MKDNKPEEQEPRSAIKDTPTTRELTDHQVNGCNKHVSIVAVGPAGPGGAFHRYSMQLRRRGPEGKCDGPLIDALLINFQNGAIGESGPNGYTNEAFLALVAHRLRGFQAGPYACTENAIALQHVEAAMHTLRSRTARRVTASIEGTMAPDPVTQTDTAAAPEANDAGAEKPAEATSGL